MAPIPRWFFHTLLVLYFLSCLAGIIVSMDIKRSPHPLTSPAIFIPGHGGNQMEYLVEASGDGDQCPGTSGNWVRSWLDVWLFLPGKFKCWSHHMTLQFDSSTGSYSNQPGVDVRVPGWGKTETIEYIDPSIAAWLLGNKGAYAAPLVKELKNWGYISGSSLRGAPYDFRYGANYQPKDYYRRMRSLVENMYASNNEQQVTLVAHSMGGLLLHHFLVNTEQSWKDKHVRAMVTLNTPWKGTVTMLIAVLSGYTWGAGGLDPLILRNVQQNSPSGVYMLPSTSAWGAHDILVRTASKNYTAHDLDDVLVDAGFSRGAEMRARERRLSNQTHPGVDIYCLYSSGIATPSTLVYADGDFPDSQPEFQTEDGDGTANKRSLQACHQWKAMSTRFRFEAREFTGVSHNGILNTKRSQAFLKEILLLDSTSSVKV